MTMIKFREDCMEVILMIYFMVINCLLAATFVFWVRQYHDKD